MAGNKKGVYGISHEENYTNGQMIFKEDSPGEWLYIVLTGSVETSRTVEGRKITIERLQPGDLFGEMELIGRMKRTVTAQAVGETTLGIVDRDAIIREYGQLSKQFKSILETIPVRIKKMIDRACDVSS
jgi:CRP-like cAMP-binding protein